jgi:TPR repeat protein
MHSIGSCYYYGNGVKKSLEKAAEWYKKAADRGNAYATHSLGWCYINGKGVEQS